MTPPLRIGPGHRDGGQFAPTERAATTLRLADPATRLDVAVPAWHPPSDTTTPAGAFSRCKEISAEYTSFLRSHDIAADWVHVVGPGGSFPDADPRWLRLAQASWGHYLTRVPAAYGGAVYVDWTARQFDPASGHPHLVDVTDTDWARTRHVPVEVMEQFLDAWRSEHDLAARH